MVCRNLESILVQMERLVIDDEVACEFDDAVEEIEQLEIGLFSVEPLLRLMERHPLTDFGSPGAIVHYLEKFYQNGYEELLAESIKRRPALHTVWMLNRLLQGSQDKERYRKLLREIIYRPEVEQAIRNSAQEFLND
jgi:hypothetical protein